MASSPWPHCKIRARSLPVPIGRMPTAGFIYKQSKGDDRRCLPGEYVRLKWHFRCFQESNWQFRHRRRQECKIPRLAMNCTTQGWKQVWWLRCRSPRWRISLNGNRLSSMPTCTEFKNVRQEFKTISVFAPPDLRLPMTRSGHQASIWHGKIRSTTEWA